jgi:signal transduction histidine kinase
VTLPEWLRRPALVDAGLGVVYAVSAILITLGIDPQAGSHQLDAFGMVLIATGGVALALRRRWPLPVLAWMGLISVVYISRDYVGGPAFIGVFVAVYTAAASVEVRPAALATVGTMGAVSMSAAITHSSEAPGFEHLLYLSWSIVAFMVGLAARNRRAHLASLEERARYLEETREEEARRRVAEERVRIARDLHDVVAHNIAAINLRAGAAAHVNATQPEKAAEALLAIKAASKQTLDDLRSTLRVLRDGDDAPLAPTPGLADLDELVGTVAGSGVPVEVDVHGEHRPVPAAVDVAAYRIVQESLTNVMRHAGPALVTVVVDYRPDALALEVRDDGRGAATNGAGEGGHGIEGMKERAAALGGSVEAGPRPGGGYHVRATLPWPT